MIDAAEEQAKVDEPEAWYGFCRHQSFPRIHHERYPVLCAKDGRYCSEEYCQTCEKRRD
jgi:hypothetical protein